MSVTGKTASNFPAPVCNIFRETVLAGQLCYQADLNTVRERVDRKKAATEGFVFLLDYNLDRVGGMSKADMERDQARIYIETLGKKFLKAYILNFI